MRVRKYKHFFQPYCPVAILSITVYLEAFLVLLFLCCWCCWCFMTDSESLKSPAVLNGRRPKTEGWLSGDHLTWVKLLDWSHEEAGATANKTTYGADSFKYSKPLEKHCSHWLKCEMMCGEIARGNVTIITGSSLEDIDLEDSC